MSDLVVKSSSGDYRISFADSLPSVSLRTPDFFLIDDKLENPAYTKNVPYLNLHATEEMKNLSTVGLVCQSMSEAGLTRESSLLAAGGGVIQDLATMAASIYKRGIPWTFAPSTLAAMVDSCIGGKSSINLGKTKNILGNFYPPTQILISIEFLLSLPKVHLLAGLAEAVKINFARGPEAFKTFLANPASRHPSANPETRELIRHTLESKVWFIERDEHDRAERQLLNFGHTFGHALESASNFLLPHGVAVALGMLAANRFSDQEDFPGRESLEDYLDWLLTSTPAFVEMVSSIDWAVFKASLLADKKGSGDVLNFILPDSTGTLTKQAFPKSAAIIDKAVRSCDLAIEEALK